MRLNGGARANLRIFRADSIPIPASERSQWWVISRTTNQGREEDRGFPGKKFIRAGLVFIAAFLLTQASLSAQDEAQQAAAGPQDTQTYVPSGPPVTVRGTVNNSATGDPLPRVIVQIEGADDAGVITDGEGRFEIPAVPQGPQTIRLFKPDFHDRPYASEDVDYQLQGPAHSVLVAQGMPDLHFALIPNGAIHGYVELPNGDPAPDIPMTLLKKVIHDGRAVWAQDGNTRTGGDGTYRFSGLPEGVYVVYTLPVVEKPPATTAPGAARDAKAALNGYPSVFYPDAREFSSVMRIRVAVGGQAQANLSVTREPFQTVAATAFFPDGRQFAPRPASDNGSAPPFFSATVLDAAGHRLPYVGHFDGVTRTIQTALPDGVYTLQVSVGVDDPNAAGGNPGPGGNRKQMLYTGFAEFSVDGHTVNNLHVPLSFLPAWPVHLRMVQTAMRPPQATAYSGRGLENMVTVSATDAGEIPVAGATENATAEASGPNQLDLNGAGFGSLWINAMVNDRSLCVDSFTAGGTNLAREPLNLNPTATPPPMELTLRDDCAMLTLELPAALSAFLPGEEPYYTVYVVPDFATTADTPPMTVHPSSGSGLTLEGLTPGDYHIYVFDSPVRLEYRNPAVLAALPNPGQPVTLSPNATTSLILQVP